MAALKIEHAYVLHNLNPAISSVALAFWRQNRLEIFGMEGLMSNAVWSAEMSEKLQNIWQGDSRFDEKLVDGAKYVKFNHKKVRGVIEVTVEKEADGASIVADKNHFVDLGIPMDVRAAMVLPLELKGN